MKLQEATAKNIKHVPKTRSICTFIPPMFSLKNILLPLLKS